MHPAFSILIFTTLAGTAQGLIVMLALAVLSGTAMSPSFLQTAVCTAGLMLVAGLASSFMHLGRKMRAWRAVLMWRTSWMSREVILLPAFIALVGLWWLLLERGSTLFPTWVLPVLLILGSAALWYCTAMIYACLRFIEEWAHPLTIVNFTLIGLSSGFVLGCALAVLAGETRLLSAASPYALALTLMAWFTRWLTLKRNSAIKHKSTLQSATGIKSPHLVQKSMGMSAGAFNTREFFHGASQLALKNVKLGFIVLAFAVPSLLLMWGVSIQQGWLFVLALVAQAPGLIAERWFFFAQAKHPQNLYYQTVS